MIQLTDQQAKAVAHRDGNLLLAASAGSGKTSVLVRRCLSLLTAQDARGGYVDVTDLLVLTFTRAAAAEMRSRFAELLRQAAEDARGAQREHLRRQLTLLETAEIDTIDAWCARVVRENYQALAINLDWQLLDESAARLLRRQVLDDTITWVARSDHPTAVGVRRWLENELHAGTAVLSATIECLAYFREQLLAPEAWFARQRAALRDEPAHGKRLLAGMLREECDLLAREFSAAARGDTEIARMREMLVGWRERLAENPADVAAVAQDMTSSRNKFNRRSAGLPRCFAGHVKQRVLDVAKECESLQTGAAHVAEVLTHLLDLESEYQRRLRARKDAAGTYEFHDIQRFALDVLSTPSGLDRMPTDAARRYRQRYRYILIDEYQDTSPIQVRLMELITNPDAPGGGNRFMVGDIKQSIYSFRKAEPDLFADLRSAIESGTKPGAVHDLQDNFRSHPRLLAAFNTLFARLFSRDFGGADFDAGEVLTAKRAPEPENPSLDRRPRFTVLGIEAPPRSGHSSSEDSDDDAEELENIEREAALVAREIHALREQGAHVPDKETGLRDMRFGDIVVLLRAASGHAPLLASTLRKAGIPAVAAGRERVLDQLEVQDVRNVLLLLEDSRDDLALAAYLRGPMVGLTAEQLLTLRRFRQEAGFGAAVKAYAEVRDDALAGQVNAALRRIDGWRRARRVLSVVHLIAAIIRDTGLDHLARALPDGAQRVAALEALESFAADFTAAGGVGVGDFVAYLDELEQADVSPAAPPVAGGDTVRVMTIHASKGLEFPVVFLLRGGAALNGPTREALRCDPDLGLGFKINDRAGRRVLRSAARRVIKHKLKRREIEEELRLFYVAATRARERFYLLGHGKREHLEGQTAPFETPDGAVPLVLRQGAPNMLAWTLLALEAAGMDYRDPGTPFAVHWHDWRDVSSVETCQPAHGVEPSAGQARPVVLSETEEDWVGRALSQLLASDPIAADRAMSAAITVSTLKSELPSMEVPESSDYVGVQQVAALGRPRFAAPDDGTGTLDGAEHVLPDGRRVGSAVHRFLQHVDFDALREGPNADALLGQIDVLEQQGVLMPEEAASLPREMLRWFARQDEARFLARHARRLRREQPFVFAAPTRAGLPPQLLRGVVDCLVDAEDGLVLFDYKTDELREPQQRRRRELLYSVQLAAYAVAVQAIHERPVRRAALIFLREQYVCDLDLTGPLTARVRQRLCGPGPRNASTAC